MIIKYFMADPKKRVQSNLTNIQINYMKFTSDKAIEGSRGLTITM